MKHLCLLITLISLLLIPSGIMADDKPQDLTDIQKVYDFIKNSGTYYLATVEGDQPRVRPFGSLAIFEGKIYIQTAKIKDVSKQIGINPKIEICAYNGSEWIRVEATAINDDRIEAKQFLLDTMPELKNIYSADDSNTQVFYLKDATARFHSFKAETVVVKF